MKYNISKILQELAKIIRLSLFVCRCKLCDADLVLDSEDLVCTGCREKIVPFSMHMCMHCGRPVGNDDTEFCGECIVNPPIFEKHISFAAYEGELRDLILKYKYSGMKRLKKLLAHYYLLLLNERVPGTFDYIIPIPQDRGRKREFNPMLEIAGIISRSRAIPILAGSLVKIKKTLPQAGLSRSKRLRNLDGAFKLIPSRISLKGKRILLLDDVYTTGTTIRKCSELLRREGAVIVALTLARSV